MRSITEKQLRSCFVNASLRERNALTLPDGFDDLRWDDLDYLGWRDRKSPQLGYVVVDLDDGPVGIMLRRSDGAARTRPQCAWCEDVHLPNEVLFFSAKRAGQAGRNGNTVGTLVCAQFECSANVRKRPPVAYVGFDVEAARRARIETLRENVRNFAATVMKEG
ncbi:treble-clef zinc-finger protein [Diaminobutyricimonas aerilata]|uniref:Treble-clef zinc-finger protein n=1 Tax=Diaminobutyricimonas aerilata TaxID=1162967 RepID=A0A2M9CJB7_9MICO|nr:FBP domain-containing protein [Diaminobutyricimonas aerilata]PJJ71982.1 treble-clef zinc-finger protein [Diaminobutyricimonas aerilata]